MSLSKGVVAFIVFCMGLCPAAAQTASGRPSSASEFPPGVVIEKVAPYSEAAKAGLAEGDVLLRWGRGEAGGAIRSPFDLATIEIEQAPRGAVTLEGFHGDQKKVWSLGQDTWGMEVRPNFPDAILVVYREGQERLAAGKLNEAEARWRGILVQSDSYGLPWLRTWLLFHIAHVQAEARHWAEADEAFQKSVPGAEILDSDAKAQVLRDWGTTFASRNDWVRAEQCYTQALETNPSPGGESLSRALDLENLGNVFYSKGDLAKALDYDHRSLDIRARLAPGSLAMAASLNNLGRVEDDRNELVRAEEYSEQALAIGEALAPGSFTVSTSLRNLGIIAMDRGDLDKAEAYHQRSLKLRERLAPASLETAATLTSLGSVAYLRDQLTLAEDYYRQSLAIRQELIPESLDVAASLSGLGLVSLDRAEITQAEAYFQKALALRRRLAPGSFDVANALYGLGNLEKARGDLVKAEKYIGEATDIAQRLAPDALEVEAGFNNLGGIASDRGDLPKAEAYFRDALAIVQRLAPDSLETARVYTNLGRVVERQGNLAKAEQYQILALAISRSKAPDSSQTSEALLGLGLIALKRGNLASAGEECRQALAIAEKLAPFGEEAAESLACLGDEAQKRFDLPEAEQHYRAALEIWEKLSPGSDNQAKSLAALASIAYQRGQLSEAASLYEQTLDTLDKQTTKLGGTEDVRAGFRAKYENYHQQYASLLVQQGNIDLAFAVMERARARTLLEMLTTAHLEIHRGADPALLDSERSLRENINSRLDRRIRLLSGKHTEEQIAELDKEISSLRDQYEAVEAQLRAASPEYAALTQPQPLTSDQVRQLLDANTVLLEYFLGEQHSYVFAVTEDSITAHELPPRLEIERLTRSAYQALTARKRAVKGETSLQREARWTKADRNFRSQSSQLSTKLLAPVAAEIAGKRLLVVSDGALQYLPFAALPDPARASASIPLAMGHEVINLPSASVLALLRRQEQQRRPAAKTVAVLADPVFSMLDERVAFKPRAKHAEVTRDAAAPNSGTSSESTTNTIAAESLSRSVRDIGLLQLSRLPFTRLEAAKIMSLVPDGQGMEALDFRATRATATSGELQQYRIIHFATHGLLNNQHPELSGLVLSLVDKHGKPQNGFLSLEGIYNMSLPADLVVLSACETGLGKEIKGEGLIGLTRGFMYAGANRVVASLWSVDDAATAELMAAFYRGMLHDGLAPAAALRKAQIQMWKSRPWKSPYYWAAFQIQGDWR